MIYMRMKEGIDRYMRTIEVVDYRPEWEKMFKEEEKEIRNILGKTALPSTISEAPPSENFPPSRSLISCPW